MKRKFLSFLCGMIILGVMQVMAQGSVEYKGSVGGGGSKGGESPDRNWSEPGRNHDPDRSAREQADRDRAVKEQADRERVAREQADRERVAREVKHDKFISDVKVNRDKLNIELQNGMQHLAIKKDGLEMFQSFQEDLNNDRSWHGGDLDL